MLPDELAAEELELLLREEPDAPLQMLVAEARRWWGVLVAAHSVPLSPVLLELTAQHARQVRKVLVARELPQGEWAV